MTPRLKPLFLRLVGLAVPLTVAACGDPCLDDGFGPRGEKCQIVPDGSGGGSAGDSGTTMIPTTGVDTTAGTAGGGGCDGDEDCGDLLHCDPKSGLCRTTAPAGKSLGEKCTDGGSSECTGNCAPSVNPGSSVPFTYTCTQNCTIGALPQCGWDGAGKAPGFCLITSLLNSSPGVGDQGLCVQLCSCNSDCGNPDLVCRALNSSGLETALGQHGYCHTPVNEDGGTDPGITACN